MKSARLHLLARPIRSVMESLLSVALPLHCPVCSGAGRHVTELCCTACRDRLVQLSQPICPACRRYRDYDSETCPGNHPAINPPLVWALGVFDQAWRAIVHQLKYRGDRSLADPIGAGLAHAAGRSLAPETVIVPVPTSAHKLRERGFGHAERVAGSLAACLTMTCEFHALSFTRRVKDQTRLSGPQRLENLRGAMVARIPDTLSGRAVLVVDDILTTGATIREAARALEAGGATSVRGAVVAVNTGGLPDGQG